MRVLIAPDKFAGTLTAVEAADAIPHNAAILMSKGVLTTINSDSDERARRLYQEAAKAVKYGGAPEDEALRMITLNAAKQLGIANRVGSIEVGKDADLAIFSAHPFSPQTRVEKTIIDGALKGLKKRVEGSA